MAEEQLENLTVNDEEDVVDPWNVAGKSETGIDYDKLISSFLFIFILWFIHYLILRYIFFNLSNHGKYKEFKKSKNVAKKFFFGDLSTF